MRHKKLLTIALTAAIFLTGCSGVQGSGQTVTPLPYGTEFNALGTPIIKETPVPTDTPKPTATSTPTNTPKPTATKKPTNTPKPTATKKPTSTPKPTNTPTPIPDPNGVPEWREMLSQMGTGWNLGNTLDAKDATWFTDEMKYETAWVGEPKVSQKMIDTVAEAGFTTIRVPVSWHNHVTKTVREDGSSYYRISEKWMKRVHEIVDYCYNAGLFVILNIHHDDADAYYVYPDSAHEAESMNYVVSIWEQIATEFGDYDYHLIFETLNEPRLVGASEWNPGAADAREAQKYINRYNQAAVFTIRTTEGAYNGVRYIGCPGYAASMWSLDGFELPQDPSGLEGRIMASVHAYTPYNFATAKETSFNSSVKNEVDGVFNMIKNKLLSKNIPAYIGEWGVYAEKNNYDARMKYVDYYISSSYKVKDSSGTQIRIPMIIWDNNQYATGNESYGILNRKNNTWFEDEFVKAIVNAGK